MFPSERRVALAAYVVGLVLGAALLLASGYADRSPDAIRGGDFAQFWVGPRALMNGFDPYSAASWRDTAARLGSTRTDTPVFGYFGWSLLLLSPFALLDLETASAVWLFAGLISAAIATWALLRSSVTRMPIAYTLVGTALLGSQPARLTVLLGQWGFVLLAALAGTVVLLRQRRELPAALAAVPLIVKPHLFLLSGPAIAAWAWQNGARRFVPAAIVIAGALVALSVIVMPGWPGAWLHDMPARRLFDPPQTTTIAAVFYGLLGNAGTWLALGAIAAGALVASRFDVRTDAGLAVWLALSAVAAPYTWSYDHLLLLVPLVIATGAVARRSARAAIALVAAGTITLLVVSTLLAVVAAARNLETYTAVVPAAIVVMIVVAAWQLRATAPREATQTLPVVGTSTLAR